MKQTIENLIPEALILIEAWLGRPAPADKGGDSVIQVEKVYKGYIASMGASLIQSGLLPTLAIFSADDSGDKGDRRKLMRILTELLKHQWKERYGEIPAVSTGKDEIRLLVFAVNNKDNASLLRQLRRDLTQASVALKLALRTYNLV